MRRGEGKGRRGSNIGKRSEARRERERESKMGRHGGEVICEGSKRLKGRRDKVHRT